MSNPLDTLSDKSRKTLDALIIERTLPPWNGNFDITEAMLQRAIEVYGELFGNGNGKFNFNLARKLHGLNILKLKFSRGMKLRDCKEGMVYLIANPCWPNYIKIGMTIDLDNRLNSYQTYDPFKRFYVKNYEFCLDRRAAEKGLLEQFNVHLAEGEWIKHHDSLRVIKHLRNY